MNNILLAKWVRLLNWENSVVISGKMHFLKGRSEGETGVVIERRFFS